jgi:hypothetical protein
VTSRFFTVASFYAGSLYVSSHQDVARVDWISGKVTFKLGPEQLTGDDQKAKQQAIANAND